jgi:hypothetical protein
MRHVTSTQFARLAVGLALVSTGRGQECTAILGYVRDTSSVESSLRTASSFKRFFCDQQFSSYQQARDNSLKVGIPIDDLPLSIENHDRTTEWQQYQRTVCERIETFTSLDSSFKSVVIKANDAVVKAWSDCISSPGVKFWAEANDSDPKLVVLLARYNSEGAPYLANMRPALDITPSSNLDCGNHQLGTYRGMVGAAFTDYKNYLDNKASNMSCRRTNNQAVNVVLKTERGDRNVKLPVIVVPPPEPPKPVTETITEIKSQYCVVPRDQWVGQGPKYGDKHLAGLVCTAPDPIEPRADSPNYPHVDTVSLDGEGCPSAVRMADLDLFINPTTVNLRIASNSAAPCFAKFRIYYKVTTTRCIKNCPPQ